MKPPKNYKFFSNYILRSPLFSLTKYKIFTSEKNITDEQILSLFNDPTFNEALFLASPSFHSEVAKWNENQIIDIDKKDKLKLSILKYYSRMSSRCTPFGLFAGCVLGSFGDETNIKLKNIKNHKRNTRLDMNYLVSFSQDLMKVDKIKCQLLFYPNNSIYKIYDKLRYVEYYYKNNMRFYDIVAVDFSKYLDIVLECAKEGVQIKKMVTILVNDEINEKDAIEFIDELISNQILVSELEPSVSGPLFLDQIISVLNKLENTDEILSIFINVDKKLKQIDNSISNKIDKYIKVSKMLKKIPTEFDLKYLFQTDLILEVESNKIDVKYLKKLQEGLSTLNKLTIPRGDSLLSDFKKRFYERYESQELPLSKVLDIETGIGYKNSFDNGDLNPLIDDIPIPFYSNDNVKELKWTKADDLFLKKIHEAYREDFYTIQINDEDLVDFPEDWDNLPDTMSYIIEFVQINNAIKIRFSGGGGSSAANLLGRFCHGDNKILEFTKKIIDIEDQIHSEKILAEIIHLPEARVGNILTRPSLRKYEIPYLAKSCKNSKYQIPVEDLLISIKKNRIFLKSKKYNKEVIPHLSTAHNFTNNSLPIYHFLCDMQIQTSRRGVGVDLSQFSENYDFLPRIEYKDIIIQEASWNLGYLKVKKLLTAKSDEELINEIDEFKKSLKIPTLVMLVERDNELLINLNNLTSVKMWLSLVEKLETFTLKEFLHNETPIVNNGSEYFTNQIIFSIYNNKI
ncbi:MAG: lantibiotic dehydratase [Flavobacteriia bacterium]|nr:lantibiotic dehydratase [Flavobacteriia bacterium]NCT18028.1 lantibiotic dehydratase [Flavobacteriia bacterium]